MKYLSVPVSFKSEDSKIGLEYTLEDRVSMLDNLVELIVFTARGSASADLDFGLEYWNHEYTNVNYREFNNGQTRLTVAGVSDELSKKECQESILHSLNTYAPILKNVEVSMELDSANMEKQRTKKVPSKFIVTINVNGVIDDGLGTTCDYNKSVKFFMEPTAKKLM